MRSVRRLAAVLLLLVGGSAAADTERDLESARALLDHHLDAIRNRDREAFAETLLSPEEMVRLDPRGLVREKDASWLAAPRWPETFETTDLELVAIRPGVVFASYRYRLRVVGSEHTGTSERLLVDTGDGWRISLLASHPAPPRTPPPARAFLGATLVDGTGSPPVEDAAVVVRSGLITCAGTRADCPVDEETDVVDLAGRWLVPGLVDVHVHFSATGTAIAPSQMAEPETVAEARVRPERLFRAFLCSGVTAVFDVAGYPWLVEHRFRSQGNTLAPHVAITGPALATLDLGVGLPAEQMMIYLADEDAARRGVRYLASLHVDAVKLWFVPGRREFVEMEPVVTALGEEAAARGVRIVTHALGQREARIALRAGAKVLLHSISDPIDDEILKLLVEGDVVYAPTLSLARSVARLKKLVGGEAPLVDDPNGCIDPEILAGLTTPPEDPPEGITKLAEEMRFEERRQVAEDNLLRVRDAGVTLAVGTDAGAPMVAHGPAIYAEMEAMQEAGLQPMDVIVAATRGGARAMGRELLFGTLVRGRIADMLVLDADPTEDVKNLRRLRSVVRGGEMRSVHELRARPGGSGGDERLHVKISPQSPD